jgi:hypothetical protein
MSFEEQTEHPVSHVKWLDSNCHVSGKFGDLLSAEDDNRRWKHTCLFGTSIAAIDHYCYCVLFHNNKVVALALK